MGNVGVLRSGRGRADVSPPKQSASPDGDQYPHTGN